MTPSLVVSKNLAKTYCEPLVVLPIFDSAVISNDQWECGNLIFKIDNLGSYVVYII